MPDAKTDIELVDPDDLLPYANNPKEHPDEQIETIASSIKNYGWDQPIVVDADYEIIKGHGRQQAAKMLGLDEVPVIRREDLTDAEAKAARIADNKTSESDWNDDMLSSELDVLDVADDIDMDSLGFDDDELGSLLDDLDGDDGVDELDEPELEDKALEDIDILNLYAGIGGNRKLWGDQPNVTAVEYNDEIAKAYQDHFPDDTVVVDDAHDYLLNHFDEFDFIWTSPPCPTHSKMRKNLSVNTGADPVYPDMKLYAEILLLQGYFEGEYVVENVDPWYDPLIEPQKSGRHIFWSSFDIPNLEAREEIKNIIDNHDADKQAKELGYDPDKLSEYSFPSDYPRDKVINNMVHPEVGKAILESAVDTEL
jgi:DNA (cytosine-5)-methyltransferase 1